MHHTTGFFFSDPNRHYCLNYNCYSALHGISLNVASVLLFTSTTDFTSHNTHTHTHDKSEFQIKSLTKIIYSPDRQMAVWLTWTSAATDHGLIDQHQKKAFACDSCVWAQHYFLARASLQVCLRAPPVPPANSCWRWSAYTSCTQLFHVVGQQSIKTIILMSVLFTPVLNRHWMSTLWRTVASGSVILFQRQTTGQTDTRTVRPPESSSSEATLMYAACLLYPAWHSKSLWEHRRALLIWFHKCIIWMSFSHWTLT